MLCKRTTRDERWLTGLHISWVMRISNISRVTISSIVFPIWVIAIWWIVILSRYRYIYIYSTSIDSHSMGYNLSTPLVVVCVHQLHIVLQVGFTAQLHNQPCYITWGGYTPICHLSVWILSIHWLEVRTIIYRVMAASRYNLPKWMNVSWNRRTPKPFVSIWKT
jgi:hypothetical protein